jgi:hypothetical protein
MELLQVAWAAPVLAVLLAAAVWMSPRGLRNLENYCAARAAALDAYRDIRHREERLREVKRGAA